MLCKICNIYIYIYKCAKYLQYICNMYQYDIWPLCHNGYLGTDACQDERQVLSIWVLSCRENNRRASIQSARLAMSAVASEIRTAPGLVDLNLLAELMVPGICEVCRVETNGLMKGGKEYSYAFHKTSLRHLKIYSFQKYSFENRNSDILSHRPIFQQTMCGTPPWHLSRGGLKYLLSNTAAKYVRHATSYEAACN